MEVNVPIQIPDLTVRKLVVGELESMFVALNHAHGQCLEGNPTQYFSEDPEEEKKHLEDAIHGLDLIHGFMRRELVDSVF